MHRGKKSALFVNSKELCNLDKMVITYIFSWIKQHDKHNGELLFCTLPSLNKHIKLDQTPQIKRGKWYKVVTKGQESAKVPKDPQKCRVWHILRRNRKRDLVFYPCGKGEDHNSSAGESLLWATLRSSHAKHNYPPTSISLH